VQAKAALEVLIQLIREKGETQDWGGYPARVDAWREAMERSRRFGEAKSNTFRSEPRPNQAQRRQAHRVQGWLRLAEPLGVFNDVPF
jgi:hypothetical protein